MILTASVAKGTVPRWRRLMWTILIAVIVLASEGVFGNLYSVTYPDWHDLHYPRFDPDTAELFLPKRDKDGSFIPN
jgi:hypothetical protein